MQRQWLKLSLQTVVVPSPSPLFIPFDFSSTSRIGLSCTCILSRLAYVVRDELFCAINMFTLRQTSDIFCAEIKGNFSVGSKQD